MLHVAIPVQDELTWLPRCLSALEQQVGAEFTVWICVNQPDAWHRDAQQVEICSANRQTLELLKQERPLRLELIDHSSPGRGWEDKRGGVGRARKVIMDVIAERAGDRELIVSLDADTELPTNYLQQVEQAFIRHPDRCGLSAPYRHPLTDDDSINRAMLRYEIYMRYYALNLWRIRSPYAFTALGSAIALPVEVYRQMGGITPRPAAEDFYFLQKLAKHGRLIQSLDAVVIPATRKSWRVPVGTGQAIIAGCDGLNPQRYPLYEMRWFDDIGRTTETFETLHERSCETPLDDFLNQKLKTSDPWQRLRKNNPEPQRFIRACHERVDGLRILQYLKERYRDSPSDDSESLQRWLQTAPTPDASTRQEAERWASKIAQVGLDELPTASLDALRDFLFDLEARCRKRDAES